MSTTAINAALTAQNAALTAQANAAARRARVDRCVVEMRSYDPVGATAAEMRSYADCVETLHPMSVSGVEVIALKAVIVICFAAFFCGGYYGLKTETDLGLVVLSAFTWFLGALVGSIFLGGVIAAVVFLFS